MKNMTFNCNDVIFKQGDFAETMYDVVSGKVGVYADFQTDKEQLLACFGLAEAPGRLPVSIPALDGQYKPTDRVLYAR